MTRKKIVLYQPQQVDESIGPPSTRDMLPLEMLTISAYPLADGYEIRSSTAASTAGGGHRRRSRLRARSTRPRDPGNMVTDGLPLAKVKARHPSCRS
jgi:hypothetical protein